MTPHYAVQRIVQQSQEVSWSLQLHSYLQLWIYYYPEAAENFTISQLLESSYTKVSWTFSMAALHTIPIIYSRPRLKRPPDKMNFQTLKAYSLKTKRWRTKLT